MLRVAEGPFRTEYFRADFSRLGFGGQGFYEPVHEFNVLVELLHADALIPAVGTNIVHIYIIIPARV